MAITSKLLDTATAEWKRWGFSAAPLHKPKQIGGIESTAPFVGFVQEYWIAVGRPERNGLTPLPWSAAFISFCFKEAGAEASFPYSEGHYHYCAAILKGMSKADAPIRLEDPTKVNLGPGDLIWAGRTGLGCASPPRQYKDAIAALKKKDGFFCSHADIVVEIRDGEVDVIGGNVSDSVTKTTYLTTKGKITDPRHAWLAVIKNTI